MHPNGYLEAYRFLGFCCFFNKKVKKRRSNLRLGRVYVDYPFRKLLKLAGSYITTVRFEKEE